jgi:hypothetical protein
MATRRKACSNCTTAKRKCVVQLPRCRRCAEKNIDCVYDLDHLTTPTKPYGEHLGGLLNKEVASTFPRHCLMNAVSMSGPHADPSCGAPKQENTLAWVRLGYQSAPALLESQSPAAFIHPKMRIARGCHNHLQSMSLRDSQTITVALDRLLRLDTGSAPMQEMLTALQASMVYIGTLLCTTSGELNWMVVERALAIAHRWARCLLMGAQQRSLQLLRDPEESSLWQEWLFGESVRRTILMYSSLAMSYNVYRHGYCTNWLFVESLPFDRRPGLWMAQTPQAWIAAAKVRSGAEVGVQLSSVHEFAEEMAGKQSGGFCGDLLMALVTLAHNGYEDSA